MLPFVSIILLAWIPASLLLFRFLRPSTAVLVTIIGGWAILPNAAYVPPAVPESAPSVMAVALPSELFLTKAIATSVAALAGVLLFDRRRLQTVRPGWWDLPIAIWCLSPILPWLGGYIGLAMSARSLVYLLLAWGVPWWLGRIYFQDLASIRHVAIALVLAGAAYLLPCAIEFFASPTIYSHVYGHHPFQGDGSGRYVGHRPLVFLEDGNQLGMWMAGAALVAIWLWLADAMPPLGRIKPAAVAIALLAMAILCQSVGSIILLFAGVAMLLAMQRFNAKVLIAAVLLVFMLFLGIRATGAWSVKKFARQTRIGQFLEKTVKGAGRGSLGWRLQLEERHVGTALRHPLTGTGSPGWWRVNGQTRPWGLWLLAFGMYGAPGLISLHLIFLCPMILLLRTVPGHDWRSAAFAAPAALASLLMVTMIDNLLNSAFILPLLVAAGAMVNTTRVAEPNVPQSSRRRR